jgi:hypothetical protein
MSVLKTIAKMVDDGKISVEESYGVVMSNLFQFDEQDLLDLLKGHFIYYTKLSIIIDILNEEW